MKNFKSLIALIMIICVILTVCSCVEQHEHDISTEWSSDATYHWQACNGEGCNEKANYTSHNYGEGELTTPATEESEGVMTYKCKTCGYEKTESIDKLAPSHKHSLTKKEEIAPSCQTPGVAEYYFCVCGAKFSDAEGTMAIDSPIVLAPIGHTEELFGEERESTCSINGISKGVRCSVCLEVIKAPEILELSDHRVVSYVYNNDATCHADGTQIGTCEYCGKQDVKPAEGTKLDHVYTQKITDEAHLKSKAQSCLEYDVYWYDCETCDANAKDNANAQDRFYNSDIIGDHKVSAAWSSDGGYHFHKCENGECSYVEGTEACADVTTDADHSCDTCAAADVSEHEYAAWVELDEDRHQHVCNCGYTENEAHAWNDGVVSIAPTHFEQGEKTLTCIAEGCGATKLETLPMLTEHTYDQKNTELEGALVSAADCEKAASYRYSCICGAIGSESFTDGEALGHNWNEGVVTTQPTCVAEGVKTFTCERGCQRTETLSVVDHNIVVIPAEKATCSSVGLSEGKKCSVCQVVIVEQNETPVEPHAWNNPYIVVNDGFGYVVYTCKNCDEVDEYRSDLPKDAHVCDHLVHGVETEYDKWTTCSECGAKSYAVTALSAYKGSGATHASVDVYVLKEGATDATKSANLIKSGTKVSDVAVTYNITSGSDRNSSYVEFTYKIVVTEATTVNVFFNGRSTNLSGGINQAAQINKFMKLYQNGKEIAISNSAILPAYIEGYPHWTEQCVATVDLVAGENTFTFRFTKEGGIFNGGKYYGAYASYFRFAEAPKTEGCESGYHILETVLGTSVSCTHSGVQMHYACANCDKVFDYYTKVEVKYENLIIPAYSEHIYDSIPHPYTDSEGNTYYAYPCVRGCGAKQIHTCTDDGKHLIIAREPNKVWYEDGDVFNPDRMEVYLSNCAEGCGDNVLVAGHLVGYDAVTYTYQNGDSFKAGDTYIIVNYNDGELTYHALISVTVTAVGDTITIDNSSENFSYTNIPGIEGDHPHNPGVRVDDQGKVGQSAYGGSYSNNFTDGDIVKFTFTVDEDGKAHIVLRAATDRITSNIKYAYETIANEMMIVYLDGQVINLADSIVFEGSVANIDPNANRWTWTIWSNIDLGVYDLAAGEHTIEILYNNISDYKSAEGYNAHVQIDCLNVFLGE